MDCLSDCILKSIVNREGVDINICKPKKTIDGFTLIEIMIVVVIFGGILIFGGNYFYSVLSEYRISVQHDYLYREAIYAMDFIINGRMEQGVRYDGIITYHDAVIPNAAPNTNETTKINLHGDGRNGRIYTVSDTQTGVPPSLWIESSNGTRHKILPTKEAPTPYEIDIEFSFVNNDNSLINIRLTLHQENVYDREGIEAKMNSRVRLRN